jgi:hypothetical protein
MNSRWWLAQDGNPDYIWLRANPDATFSFGTRDTSNHWASTSSTGQTDKWYFLAGLFRPKNGYEIYVYDTDGLVEHSSSSDTTYAYVDANTHIGNRNNSSQTLDGSVEDVRIYSRALSELEIEALANLSQPSGVEKSEDDVPVQSEGGITRYKLNGDVTDSWGDNNGTNNGADLTATGVYGQAAAFDGSNEFTFRDPLDQIASSNRFSISLWIKPNDIFDGHSRVLSAVDKSNTGILLKDHRNSSGKGYDVTFFDSTGDNHTLNPTAPFKANKWHHWVVCYDGTRLYSYINGSVDKEKSISASISNEKDHTIGGSSTGEGYSGKIDDVRIYDKALTPLQVEKLYHKGAYRIPRESTLQ